MLTTRDLLTATTLKLVGVSQVFIIIEAAARWSFSVHSTYSI